MYKYSEDRQLCFDDILMVPQPSHVMSRKDVDLEMYIGNDSQLSLPVIAAPMDTVCEYEMAITLARAGGLGIIHRFLHIEQQADMITQAYVEGLPIGAAVGAKGDYIKDTEKLLQSGASTILVDTANGHSKYAIDAVESIRDKFGNGFHLMAGNVSTPLGYRMLSDVGADSVRVGIGGGSVCTTRIISGHGIPTLASIIDIRRLKEKQALDTGIIADGGIRNTGDMIKAFAAGADAVMLGSMLSGTDESPGALYFDETGKYKAFRGMASKEANEGKDIAVAEGVATRVPYKGSVSHILNNIRGGLGSGCSYSGVKNLSDLYDNAMYIEVSSLSVSESKPHALR